MRWPTHPGSPYAVVDDPSQAGHFTARVEADGDGPARSVSWRRTAPERAALEPSPATTRSREAAQWLDPSMRWKAQKKNREANVPRSLNPPDHLGPNSADRCVMSRTLTCHCDLTSPTNRRLYAFRCPSVSFWRVHHRDLPPASLLREPRPKWTLSARLCPRQPLVVARTSLYSEEAVAGL